MLNLLLARIDAPTEFDESDRIAVHRHRAQVRTDGAVRAQAFVRVQGVRVHEHAVALDPKLVGPEDGPGDRHALAFESIVVASNEVEVVAHLHSKLQRSDFVRGHSDPVVVGRHLAVGAVASHVRAVFGALRHPTPELTRRVLGHHVRVAVPRVESPNAAAAEQGEAHPGRRNVQAPVVAPLFAVVRRELRELLRDGQPRDHCIERQMSELTAIVIRSRQHLGSWSGKRRGHLHVLVDSPVVDVHLGALTQETNRLAHDVSVGGAQIDQHVEQNRGRPIRQAERPLRFRGGRRRAVVR